MRNLWDKCAHILIFQFVLVAAALPNTLTVSDQGEVFAETDRYLARFENGVLMHFHNKLTQETYTQGEYDAITRLKTSAGSVLAEYTAPEIKRLSPLECELIYRENDATLHLHLFIGIDVETGDLLIRQKAFSETGGIERIMWGFSNLSHASVDLIAPLYGGKRFTENSDSRRYIYPGTWEAQLAILQGQRGGVFVRSDDTQYEFKTLELENDAVDDSFAINFWQMPPTLPDPRTQITTATWRLNAYQSDWQVPALHYRNWMHTALLPVDRSEMPDWVDDIELVITHANPLEVVGVGVMRILSQLVDPEKTLLYVTGWRKAGWSLNYPDQTPTDNFGYFMRVAHEYGFKVMLHTNMVAVSLLHPLYPEFEKYQMVAPWNGEKLGQRLNDPTEPLSRRYIWVNAASRSFRKILVDQLKSVWETYNVDAFHLDISHVILHNNALIDGLTMAEGNILLHQELREAMPGIVLGGEGLNDVTFLHESFAQRGYISAWRGKQVHPISSFLFSPYTKLYGHLGFPNPDRDSELFQVYQDGYEVWDVLPTIRLDGKSDLAPDLIETHKLLELARERQNWVFGDVNSDGVVNILDLTLVAQYIGTLNPSNRRIDVNSDGVVNILDLVIVANAFGNYSKAEK